MVELVALHTQALEEPLASEYLRLFAAAVASARLSKQFPDRRGYGATLAALGSDVHRGLYTTLYLDARAGLPNMASMTRVVADQHAARSALPTMTAQTELEARREQAKVYDRLARKRPYYEALSQLELAPVDQHRVFLRRHEPEHSRASFRIELTKLAANGCYLRVAIELSQTAGLWSDKLVELDAAGEVGEGTEALRGMVYRFAAYDSEALFLRLHELPGVVVERVARGIVGPVVFALPDGTRLARPVDPRLAALVAANDGVPQIVASFATDIAATDVAQDKSNDPLSPLMAESINEAERARYDATRARFDFRVYKDRKFAATASLLPELKAVCKSAGTRNLVYPIRARGN